MCSFVLMSSCLSIFLVIEALEFRAVSDDTRGRFDDVITQVTVTGLVHLLVFSFEFTGLITLPDDAAVFRKGIVIFESFDSSDLSQDAGRKYFADPGDGIQYGVLGRVQPLHGLQDRSIDCFQFFFKGLDAIERGCKSHPPV